MLNNLMGSISLELGEMSHFLRFYPSLLIRVLCIYRKVFMTLRMWLASACYHVHVINSNR